MKDLAGEEILKNSFVVIASKVCDVPVLRFGFVAAVGPTKVSLRVPDKYQPDQPAACLVTYRRPEAVLQVLNVHVPTAVRRLLESAS